MSVVCLVLAIIAPFAYDDQKKASEGTDGKSKDAVQAEIDAAKAAMLTKPGKFVVFLVMFYAFLCMAIMYGAQQYTKAFGLSVCGLSEMQAAGMTSIYTIGSICAVLFWAFMMAKLKWNPLKVVLIDSISTAVALAGVLFIHQVAIILHCNCNVRILCSRWCSSDWPCSGSVIQPGTKGKKHRYLLHIYGCSKLPDSGSSSTAYKSIW